MREWVDSIAFLNFNFLNCRMEIKIKLHCLSWIQNERPRTMANLLLKIFGVSHLDSIRIDQSNPKETNIKKVSSIFTSGYKHVIYYACEVIILSMLTQGLICDG